MKDYTAKSRKCQVEFQNGVDGKEHQPASVPSATGHFRKPWPYGRVARPRSRGCEAPAPKQISLANERASTSSRLRPSST